MKEIIFILIFDSMLPSWRDDREKLSYIEILSDRIVFWSRYDEPRLDPIFVMTIIQAESSYQADLIHKNQKATGLMQIMQNGVAAMGYSQEELLDIDRNLIAGTNWLRKGYRQCSGNYKQLYGWYRSAGRKGLWEKRDQWFWNLYQENIKRMIYIRNQVR